MTPVISHSLSRPASIRREQEHHPWDNRALRVSFWYMVTIATFRASLPLIARRKLLGASNIPSGGPFIVVSDSITLDALMAVACEFPPPLHTLGSLQMLGIPVLGRILREINVLPVEAGDGGLDFALPLKVLLLGGSLVALLPPAMPGDIEQPPVVTGVGMLAYESAAPVVPVRVFTPPCAPKGRMVVKVGRPTRFSGAVGGLSPFDKHLAVGSSILSMLAEVRG